MKNVKSYQEFTNEEIDFRMMIGGGFDMASLVKQLMLHEGALS